MADEIQQEERNGYGDNDDGTADSMEVETDNMQKQLVSTIALQQKEIDGLKAKLDSVLKRLDTLEASSASQNQGKSGPMRAFATPRTTASAPSRRQTMDPRQLRKSEDQTDGPAGSRRRPAPMNRRFQSREKISTVKEKDEPGTYRMYLQGRPITFRLPDGYEPPANAETASAPHQTLKLNWVYGYRGKDCRNNILLLDNEEIVYFTAAVCVIQNTENRSQRHYLEHTDDIKCIAAHPDKVTIATGQVAGHARPAKGAKGSSKAAANDPNFMPHIRIWNSQTLETMKIIGAGTLDRAVACISFSVTNGGQHLCAVDEHNDHRMSIWDWNKGARGTKLAEMKASQDPVYQAEFHPAEANQIVCCGKNQLSFWTFDGSKNLTKKMALFEKNDKPKFVTCLAFTADGNVITGDSNGSILIWNKGSNRISSVIANAHEGVIFSLSIDDNGALVSGGGKDHMIKTWDIENKSEIAGEKLSEEMGSCRTVVKKGDTYIVGTTRNVIVSGENLSEPMVIVQGHFGEMWGLTVQKASNQFVTCAYDNHIKLWDVAERKVLWDVELEESLHCIALNQTGDLLAVGSRTPNWYLYNTNTKQPVSNGSCGNEQLECCEFSPDGSFLAFGSRDNNIYIYNVESGGESLKLLGKCQGHTSFITHIDWSSDSCYLRSNSGDYELLYWEAATCKQFTEGDKIRDLEFVTQNCTLSLNTVGMWPSGADGTDINGCAVNNDMTLLASADDFGKVNLLSYPSRTPHANAHSYSGHSSHVTSVKFTCTGDHLLSVGGKDSSVLQWSIEQ